MKRTIFGLIFLATLIVTVAPVFAQQAGENINVLPVVSKIDPVTRLRTRLVPRGGRLPATTGRADHRRLDPKP